MDLACRRRVAATAVVDVEADRAVGARARAARSSASWTSTSKPTRRPARRPETRRGVPATRRGAVEVVDVERERRPAGDGVRVRQHVEHGLGVRRRRWWSRSRSSWSRTLPARRPRVVGLHDDLVRAQGRRRLILRDDPGSSARTTKDPRTRVKVGDVHAPLDARRIRALPAARADALLAAVFLAEGVFEVVRLRDARPLAALVVVGAHRRAGRGARRPAPLAGRAAARAVRPRAGAPGARQGRHRPHGRAVLLAAARGLHVGHAHRGRARCGRAPRSPRPRSCSAPRSTPTSDGFTSYLSTVCLIALAPILFGQVLRNRARLNRALHSRAERARARARGGRRRRRARGAHADRRRPPRRRRPRAQRDDRAGGRRAADGRARPGARRGVVRGRREHRPRGADRAAPAARRAAPRGRGARARAAAEPRATCAR